MKKLIALILVGQFCLSLSAQQDKHSSMFYANPISINPGATGFFSGDIQAFMGYKDQWKSISQSPYKTVSASVEGRLLEDKLNGGFMGVGINFYNDVAGESKLTTNVYNFNLNYAVQIADDQKLALGVQPGILQRHFGSQNLSWDEQWNGSTFDTGLQSGELITSDKNTQFDINAGLYYSAKFHGNNSLNIGVSASHLLKPSFSIINTDDLHQKYTFHAGGDIVNNGGRMVINPNVLFFMQGPNREIAFGSDFRYLLKESSKHTGYYDQSSISVGGYLRVKDAFYTTLFLNLSKFSLGVSYDINISGLSVASQGRGGMELLLRYRLSLSKTAASSL